ncbi:MAG: glycosyltransferase family 1 protein [Flaviaesturariibacter sp.]|nr:glycosyltransferase family 1 protein [Flaviaesturariibacter sp.]
MRISIIGTRGIPNNYGGFEQITEQLSLGLAGYGHQVTVYCSDRHPYRQNEWNGVRLVHCYDPEGTIGTAGQFLYDLACLRHARKDRPDALLFMGYTSSAIWWRLFPRCIVVSNMDGLEWMRSKYSPLVRRFLKYAEKLAVEHSHAHIADNRAIKSYLDEAYGIDSTFIPYAAEIRPDANSDHLTPYNLQPGDYYMLMARMEPENHVDMILEGYVRSGSSKKMLVVGSTENRYGHALQKKFAGSCVTFAGGLFDQAAVHSLRAFSALYFHGHSVGGTNPSLLEAMASKTLIAAHRNRFNRSVLGPDAFYFSEPAEVASIMQTEEQEGNEEKIARNAGKIATTYHWPGIVAQYDALLLSKLKPHERAPHYA